MELSVCFNNLSSWEGGREGREGARWLNKEYSTWASILQQMTEDAAPAGG